jgi:hypothetical protein
LELLLTFSNDPELEAKGGGGVGGRGGCAVDRKMQNFLRLQNRFFYITSTKEKLFFFSILPTFIFF